MICLKEIKLDDVRECFLLDYETLKFWNIEQWKDEISKKTTFAVGIVKGLDLVGVCVYQKIICEAELIYLSIHPNHRRVGLGKTLISNLVSICIKDDLHRIILEVSVNNKVANKFYEDCGFKTFGSRKKYYRDGSDAILKEKKL